MRGIVVEEDITYGVVQHTAPPKQPKLEEVPPAQNLQETFIDIGDESLFSAEGYKKFTAGWKKIEPVLLTTKHFESIPIDTITKLKIYEKSDLANHHTLKIRFDGGEFVFSFQRTDAYCLFYKTFWARLAIKNIHIDPNQDFINSCDGQCLKKSEIMGNWEERYLLITIKNGLMSFRNRNEAPTLEIRSTHELWTRFAVIQERKYIVFKLWYGVIKEEIAVPIGRSVKWLKAFYSLLKP